MNAITIDGFRINNVFIEIASGSRDKYYTILVEGLIPKNLLANLSKICNTHMTLKVKSKFLSYFGVDSCIVESFVIPKSKLSMQPFSINIRSRK